MQDIHSGINRLILPCKVGQTPLYIDKWNSQVPEEGSLSLKYSWMSNI